MGKRYADSDKDQARREIMGLSDHERQRKIREHMDRTGASYQTVSRWVRDPQSSRKERKDSGTTRKAIDDEAIAKMLRLTMHGWPAIRAVAAAEAHGWIPQGEITPEWYNAYLRHIGLSRSTLTSPALIEPSKGPNRPGNKYPRVHLFAIVGRPLKAHVCSPLSTERRPHMAFIHVRGVGEKD